MADAIFTNAIPRDRYDRPGILQTNGKTKFYRRTTKYISQLEDNYNLELWSQRAVAWGLGQRNDLHIAAASLTMGDEDKKALDDVAAQAKAYARTSSKATTGTALHKLCQRLDEGTPLSQLNIPDLHKDDVDAYIRWRDQMGVVWGLIETMRVNDPYQVAGTPDRTGCIRGKWYIIDLKTGSIDWDNTQREIAQQLAMYAHSTPYDPDQEARPGYKNGRFPDAPMVDQMKAIVVHLPSGEGRCEHHWVDIKKGWEGIQVSRSVWNWRKTSGLFSPGNTEVDGNFPPVENHLDFLRQGMTYDELAMAAATLEELQDVWRKAAEAHAHTTNGFKIAVQTRLAQLKGTAV